MTTFSDVPLTATVAVHTLGCDKNTVDSEVMQGLLAGAGFRLVDDPRLAEVVVVNTCCFIEPAREESVEVILGLAGLKETGRCRALLVAGCLAERFAADLLEAVPEVDGLVGTGRFGQIAAAAAAALSGDRPVLLGPAPEEGESPRPRTSVRGPSAFIKVAEGCNHRCSFCIIPRVRGPYRSRRPEVVAAEARTLAAAGVRELNLVAQDTTYYGFDLDGRLELPGLLARLDEIGFAWIRLLYAYPARVTPALREAVANLSSVVPYLDIPFQSGSDRILRLMERPERAEGIIRLIEDCRREIPGVVLRSSFIVGFPGETEADFEATLELLRTVELDHVGFFIYSREEETPAAAMADHVSPREKVARFNEAQRVQGAVAAARARRWVGETLTVLIEDEAGPAGCTGRFYGQAPEVDGIVNVELPPAVAGRGAATPSRGATPGLPAVRAGQMVQVKIEHVEGDSLLGRPAE